MKTKVISLSDNDPEMLHRAAVVMVQGFALSGSPYVPDEKTALQELSQLLAEGCLLRVAVVENGEIVGLIGGQSRYDGNVWELHALVVHPDYQGQGIGRMLVMALESLASQHGAVTLWLGADDVTDLTNLSRRDLYPDPLEALRAIRNLHGHPYEFYQKCGFAIVGVLPDANGYGKPDIFMAKRIGSSTKSASDA